MTRPKSVPALLFVFLLFLFRHGFVLTMIAPMQGTLECVRGACGRRLDRASDITAATQVGVVVSDITHFYPQAGFEVFCGGTFQPRLIYFLPAAVLESSSASAIHLKQVDWPVPILAIWFLAPIKLEAGRILSTRCVRCFAMRKLCVIPALSGRKIRIAVSLSRRKSSVLLSALRSSATNKKVHPGYLEGLYELFLTRPATCMTSHLPP